VRYLLDTDWVIHNLNGHPEIVARVQDLTTQGLALSFISLAELYEGIFYSSDPLQSEEGLQAFQGVELLGLRPLEFLAASIAGSEPRERRLATSTF
jgi:tRNA(fMet)-specific endonuclease VapC